MHFERTGVLLLLVSWSAGSLTFGQTFYPDDPIWEDHDDLPVGEVGFLELSQTYDALSNLFGSDVVPAAVRAANVNTVDEVPDSSWFTNRIGRRELTLQEMVQGGVSNGGPPRGAGLMVVGADLGSLTESLLVEDDRGDLYLFKFDPSRYPSLGTGADIVASKFLHAIGYNVLPTFLMCLDPGRLLLDRSAEVRLLGDRRKPMDRNFIDALLAGAVRDSEGYFRVSASRLPHGRIVGRFQFSGTRDDDPNDIFPHQDRRELRALQVFCAWLNHTNCNSVNTVDIREQGRRGFYLRHYLLDFTSSLGSGYDIGGRVIPKDPSAGFESLLVGDADAFLKTALTLGVWERPWRKAKYPLPELSEVGRIEADFFDPGGWRPSHPNPAFNRMLPDDAFWAIRILSRFSDEAVRAVVETAEFRDPRATDYLAETLIRRRDKLVRHYLAAVNPLYEFSLAESILEFRNLAEEIGLGERYSYAYEWSRFDNLAGTAVPLEQVRYTGFRQIPLPSEDSPYLRVRIRNHQEGRVEISPYVDVLISVDQGPKIVGVTREAGIEVPDA